MFKFRVKRDFKGDIEPHEVLLDSLAKKKEAEFGISTHPTGGYPKFEIPLFKKILQGFFIFCFLTILVLLGKTFQLQVLEGEKFTALAQENKFVIYQIQAERGVIYDKNLKQMVFNQPSFDLVLEKNNFPSETSERERILNEVSLIIKKNIEDLKKEIEESKENVLVILENLSHQELILLESKIKELSGFRINNNPKRYYLDG